MSNNNVSELLSENADYGSIQEYTSNFNFEEFQINERDKRSLEQKEHKLINAQKQIMKNLFDVAKNLYEAQQILSNYGNGSFSKWFISLGLNKDYVYRTIDKYKLSLELNDRKAIDLPVRLIKELKSDKLDKEEKIKIMNAEKPFVIIQQIREEKINFGKSKIDLINEKIEYHQEMKLKYKRLMSIQDDEIKKLKEELEILK